MLRDRSSFRGIPKGKENTHTLPQKMAKRGYRQPMSLITQLLRTSPQSALLDAHKGGTLSFPPIEVFLALLGSGGWKKPPFPLSPSDTELRGWREPGKKASYFDLVPEPNF